jgi:hypothetical protein
MTYLPSRALRFVCGFAKSNLVRSALCIGLAMTSLTAQAASPTVTTLAISATSVPYKSPITLTATVTSTGAPVMAGLVLFCDATTPICENNSALGLAQLTFPGATAKLKLGSGPLGVHSYKAVFRANSAYTASISNTVSYTVNGTYSSTTAIGSTGTVGNYTLSGTVAGIGSGLSGPTGNVSFLDASVGNNLLGTQPLGSASLSNAFVSAPSSPFAIATSATTRRSVAIASTYLSGDNNLDVVVGDALQTVTVLLGNGDGTFKPKVNYPGCPSGKALKILLADLSRDGNSDIALGCSDGTNGSLTILLGNGDGTFQSPVSYTAGDVAGIATGDFNGDGIFDIAVSNHLQQNIMLFTGKGDGTFNAPVTVLTPSSELHDVVVADFNSDGKDDLLYAINTATSGSPLSDLYLATGKGDGTFNTPTLIASQVGEFLTAGDTNSDNFPDVVSTTITGTPPNVGPSLFVLLGNGDGTFKPKVVYTSDIPSDPHLADVNGDGKVDIIAGGSYGALVYLGNGDGTFQAYIEPTIGDFTLTYAVNAGDYNNDGNADLIGTDADTPRAAVSLSEVRETAISAALTGVALYPLGSGTHNVDASYVGNSVYLGSLSSTIPLLAAPTPTTLTLSVAPAAATLAGQTVTMTATLNPYAVGPPNTTTNTEAVKFYNAATQIGTGALTNGVATFATTSLPAGTDALKAVYPGDPNYLTSTSSTVNVTVASILLSSSLNPSQYRQSVTFTASLAPGETGTVAFKEGASTLATATISGSTATYTTATLAVGFHDITAVYNGDGSHSAATSPVLTQEVDKATPVVTVTTSGPSAYGAPVTITTSVPVGTTGTVTVISGTTPLGSGTVDSNGTVTITTSALPVGSDPITATYAGDPNNNPSSGTATQTVTKATPTLPAPVVNPTSPVVGTPVTITETVPPGVTGPVSFYNGTTLLGTAPIVAGTATLTTSALPPGTDSITASTPGDTNNNPATSPATSVTVSKTTPTVTVTTSGPSTYGAPVTITATVPAGATGTVTLTSGGVPLGSGTVSPTGTVTITTSNLPAGTDTITASYGGDSNNNPSSGSTTQTVTKTTPTVTVTTSGPSTSGSPVTITATVPTGTTGTVTITSGGTTLGTGTVSPTGTVTITASTLPVGSDPITATYGGDSNNNPSSGATTQTVSKSTPPVTVTTSGPSTFGSPVTITTTLPAGTTGTVTVTSGTTTLGAGTVTPSGTVTITTSSLPVGTDPITASYGGDANNNPITGTTTQTVSKTTPTVTVTTSGPSTYGSPVTIIVAVPSGTTGTVTVTSGGVTLGTGTVSATGTVTITTSSLPAGSDTITASYGGDATNNPSTATTTQTVSKTNPTSTLTSSQNPSTTGTAVTFTDTLPSGVTGTVTFTSGTTVLGTSSVTNGVATLTTSTLPTGGDPITATYNGDTNNGDSIATLIQTVNKGAPTLTVTTSGPSTFGAPVTITSTLPVGTTGTVTLTSGTTTLGSGTVGANGTVTITTTALPVGSDPITASYSGDAGNNPVTASATQPVSKAAPTVTLISSANPSTTNQPVTFTASVPISATGTVTYLDGTTVLGTGTIVNGVATLTTGLLAAGSHTVTASYSGDANNSAATSAPLTQTVNKSTPVLPAPGVSSSSVDVGTAVTITETVPAGVTGPVSFYNGGMLLGTAPIINGVATLVAPSLPVGTDAITASTPADGNNNAATSPATTVTVSKTTPVLTAPTVSATNPAAGTPVTITQTLPTGATGTVSFYDGGTLLGAAPVINGSATLTTSALPVGSAPLSTVTSPSATTNAATSPVTTINVTKGVGAVSLSSSANPAAYNQAITFTAVSNTGAAGVVTFMESSTVLGVGAINASGIATLTTSSLAIGSHSVTAVFAGDTNYSAATSAVLVQVVSKVPTAITLGQSSAMQLSTTGVTFTANVSGPTPTPTGTVTFFDGETVLGTALLNTSGTATVSLSISGNAAFFTNKLTAGSHQITAVYSGDASFLASSSLPMANIVADFTNVAKGVVTQNMFPGGATSYTFLMAPVGSSTFLSDTTISIAGLPVGTTYAFSPAVIPAGSGPITVTLNLTTSKALSAENHGPTIPGGSGRRSLPIALGLLGLVGFGAVRRRSKQMPRLMMLILLSIASLLPIAAMTGCAGGYFALSPTTYNIQVTGTEGPIQHTATTTLIVQ